MDDWKSIEAHSRDADTDQDKGKEMSRLIAAFGSSNSINLFDI